MKKVSFFVFAAVLVSCFVLAGCGQSAAADKIVIKAANTQPLEHPMHLAFVKFKEIVESKTDGIEVQVYGNSVLGSDREVTEGVQMGAIQIGTCGTSNLSQFTDAFLVFDLPYIFPSIEDAEKVLDGEIGQNLLKTLEQQGMVGLAYTELGYRNVFNSVKSIQKLEDMNGLKLRTTSSPIHIAILKALGANPTPLSFGEVYTALQQGALDGADQDLNLAWASRFQEVQKYMTLAQSSYFPHVFLINKAFYDGLSEEHRKIISEAAKEMSAYERGLVRANEKDMISKMTADGIQVTELAADEKQRWIDAVQSVYAEFEGQIGKDIINQVRDALKK